MTLRQLVGVTVLGGAVIGLFVCIHLFQSDSRQLQKSAVHSQIHYQGRPASYWKEQMRSNSSFIRLRPLIGAGDPAAIPLIAKLLSDEDVTVRQHAAQSLSTIGPQVRAVLPNVLVALRDGDRSVRMCAALTLGSIPPIADDTVIPLIEALRDPEICVRIGAAEGLARMGASAHRSIPALQTALRDEDHYVAVQSALALYRIDRQIAPILPVLIEGLKDPNSTRRSGAAKAIKELGPNAEGAVGALVDAMNDELLTFDAVDALGAIGPKAQNAVPSLLALLKNRQGPRWWIDDALRKIDPVTAAKVTQ